MDEKALRDYYISRGGTEDQIEAAFKVLQEFENWLKERDKTFDIAKVDDIKEYVDLLIKEGLNTNDRFSALIRYAYVTKKNEIYYYLAAILGGRGVYDSIAERLETIAGKETRNAVFNDLPKPPLGSSPDLYPRCTKELMEKLYTNLPPEKVKEVLTGNHHRIPVSALSDKKKRFDASRTIDEYLVGEHKRLVEELEAAMKNGLPWYEQEITPEVVEFVKGDRTIQNGVRVGDTIIASKIPFNPAMWLKEDDPRMKRYYACHCQLARAAIRDGTPEIPRDFCYCSAGYEKLPWDVVLGEQVNVELLESVLSGGDRCRFAIKLPKEKIK